MVDHRCVALVGLRAAGKTTLGRALAGELGWDLADGDDAIAAAVGEPAGDFLARCGEPAFRTVEERLALELLGRTDHVVALGGGAVASARVRAALAVPDVLVVLLVAAPATLLDRQLGSRVRRPPLTDLPAAGEIERLWRQRRAWYDEVADFRLETDAANVDACVAEVVAKMRRARP